MELTFLGTSSMVPTKERNPSTVFLSYKGHGILFDCGEGTQRQMNIAGIKRTKVSFVLLSHWHGDHVGGLIGLLQTLGNKETNPLIHIIGPTGTNQRLSYLMKSIVFDAQINLQIHEVLPQAVESCFETEDFIIQCVALQHKTHCLGYSFIEKDTVKINTTFLQKHKIPDGPHLKKLQEGKSIIYNGNAITPREATRIKKGKKVTYMTDTLRCHSCIDLAQDADILICEATYDNSLQDKAKEYMHMTARDAAEIATAAQVQRLIITHFSQRYKDRHTVLKDAKEFFENVVAAEDFMSIKV